MDKNWVNRYQNRKQSESEKLDDDFDLFMQMSEYQSAVDTERAWQKVNSSITKKQSVTSYLMKIAAVLVLGIGILALSNYYLGNTTEQTIATFASGDALSTHQLPDGSIVTLSPHSKISFETETFKAQRHLQLEGEAYFEVRKGSNPFTINNKSGKVTVLGTSFNLNTSKELELFVTSGIVQVRTKQDSKKVTKGEYLISKNGMLSKQVTDGTNLMSWKTGHFKFDNEPLENVVTYLEKYYKVDFVLSRSIKKCTLNAEFEKLPLEEIADILSTVLDVNVSIKPNKVKISGSGCD